MLTRLYQRATRKVTRLRSALALVAAALCASSPSPARGVEIVAPTTAGTPWTAAAVAALRADVNHRLADPALRGAHVGLELVETGSGTVLYEQAADEAFVPASTLKVVTGTVAVNRLGPAFRFRTTVTGRLAGPGTVGDLIVHGGGDPLLSAADVRAAAAALAARGIRLVRGGVGIDASVFDSLPYGPGWMIDDVPYDYSAIVSGLMVDEDVVDLRVVGGAEPGAPATVAATPATGAVAVENRAVTGAPGSDETVDVRRDGATVDVVGSLPPGASVTVDAAVPDPLAYARDLFARALAAAGIALVPADEPAAGPGPAGDAPATVLWSHDSEPLARVLQWFWYRSDNLVGEALLKTLAVAAGASPGSDAAGVAVETGTLRGLGVDPATLAIVDGSGLSRYDAVTPRALVALLQADWAGPQRAVFVDALPVSGVRGTLAQTFVDAPLGGRVFAKSGSMTHVWNLAGLLPTRRHGAVTFALMVDDFVGDPDALRAAEAKLFARIVGD